MSEESEREEIKDETHQLEDEEQEELDDAEEEEEEAKTMEQSGGDEWEEGNTAMIEQSITISWKMYQRYRDSNTTMKAQDFSWEDPQYPQRYYLLVTSHWMVEIALDTFSNLTFIIILLSQSLAL